MNKNYLSSSVFFLKYISFKLYKSYKDTPLNVFCYQFIEKKKPFFIINFINLSAFVIDKFPFQKYYKLTNELKTI